MYFKNKEKFLLNEPENMVDKNGKKEKKQQFTVHTFGYGNDHDANIMNQIAKLGNGDFYFVNDLEKVAETFVDCIGG